MSKFTQEQREQRIKDLGVLYDPEDFALISAYTWQLSTHGYAMTEEWAEGWRVKIMMHRLVLGLSSEDQGVDHINRNRLDNRKANLRVCSQLANINNRDQPTGMQNIKMMRGKYQVRFTRNGYHYHVGTFFTLEEAQMQRDAAWEASDDPK